MKPEWERGYWTYGYWLGIRRIGRVSIHRQGMSRRIECYAWSYTVQKTGATIEGKTNDLKQAKYEVELLYSREQPATKGGAT